MDAAEVTALVERHAGLIRKIAYAYCRHPGDRDDVVQEIVLQLWRARDRYDRRYAETTWIYRIALNVAISVHRRERRHHGEPLDDVDVVADAGVPREVQLLRACIDELAALDKALIVMHLDGNDHAVIADVLGISVSNVGTKLARIKVRLRAALAAHGGTDG